MGVVSAREVVAGDALGLHGALRVHAEDHHVEEHLQHHLGLNVGARGAEGHEHFAAADSDRRVGGQPRPLARRDGCRHPGVGPGLGAPGRRQEPQAGRHRALKAAVAGGGREGVAEAVHYADVRGIELGRRIGRARRRSLAPFVVGPGARRMAVDGPRAGPCRRRPYRPGSACAVGWRIPWTTACRWAHRRSGGRRSSRGGRRPPG